MLSYPIFFNLIPSSRSSQPYPIKFSSKYPAEIIFSLAIETLAVAKKAVEKSVSGLYFFVEIAGLN